MTPAAATLHDDARHCRERAADGLPPLPLDAAQVGELVALLPSAAGDEARVLQRMLSTRVRPGVDEGARIKADFLLAVARAERTVATLDRLAATRLLGTMAGGFCVRHLVSLLDDPAVGGTAAEALARLVLIYDAFDAVAALARDGVGPARDVLEGWADEAWLRSRPAVARRLERVLFRVPGEITTDDLSPATDVSTRPDIPLHAQAMLKHARPGVEPDLPGRRGPLAALAALRASGLGLAFCGDIVGTGSSRMSATNSLQWHFGQDVADVPNRRSGAVCLAGQFAPIFLATQRESGALPIQLKVDDLASGDRIALLPYDGVMTVSGKPDRRFSLCSAELLDEVRAGGRIPLILGRRLTAQARDVLGRPRPAGRTPAVASVASVAAGGGHTLAQKLVARACGLAGGVAPGTYCEPAVASIASPDDAGPLTADEMRNLGCLSFKAGLVLQSFCHTSAYPDERDLRVQRELPAFIQARGGVVLRPADGILHAWMNRLLLPDAIGTGADSHTRFPLGLSFPAASGLVAFAATTGFMPLTMPESVRVRFSGRLKPHLTVRDMVHAIALAARRQGRLTVGPSGKINLFAGRILEIEGVGSLDVDQAFELTDASAERATVACTIALELDVVRRHLQTNVAFVDRLIGDGYGCRATLERRRDAMRAWLEAPALLRADPDAVYAETLDVDLDELDEPVVCCPNDPDDARPLSAVAGEPIDEVFLGSCMTTTSHFQAAGRAIAGAAPVPVRLWVAPPTRMSAAELQADGSIGALRGAGARIEPPGCSLCMGNQARVADGARVVSTSTRNYPNRLGNGARVYLASARVAGLAARLGRMPSLAEYRRCYG